MKRLLAIALALAILTGCNGSTAPPVDDDTHIVPTPSWRDMLEDNDGKWTDEMFELYEEQGWIPPSITNREIEVDPSQTGDLVIYIPMWSGTYLKQSIEHYQKIYPNVNVIIEDFDTPDADWLTYSTRVSTELAAGKGPDVLFPSFMFDSDGYKIANAGAFLDLNELIEEDTDFSFDDYVKGMLDSGIYNGKRYIIPTMIEMPTIFIASTQVLDNIGFDRTKTGDMFSFVSEAMRVLPNAQSNPNFRSMFNSKLWSPMFLNGGIRFVDFETNTVLPDEDELKKLAEIYKPYYDIDNNSSLIIYPEDDRTLRHFHSGAYVFDTLRLMSNHLIQMSEIKTNGNFEIFAVPGIDGKVHAASFNSVAIRSGSANNQNAWNFIKLLLSQEIQRFIHTNDGPVHKDAIILQFEEYHDMAVNPLSKSEAEKYIEILYEVDSIKTYEIRPIERFFSEHMRPYFEDKVSWEIAIAGLRNQLRLYVSE
jgi:multiple sugar transport system substrate-binding protein